MLKRMIGVAVRIDLRVERSNVWIGNGSVVNFHDRDKCREFVWMYYVARLSSHSLVPGTLFVFVTRLNGWIMAS